MTSSTDTVIVRAGSVGLATGPRLVTRFGDPSPAAQNLGGFAGEPGPNPPERQGRVLAETCARRVMRSPTATHVGSVKSDRAALAPLIFVKSSGGPWMVL